MGGDLSVEQRLGEGGLVGFVVTVLAVAIHVDDDVALELHPEFEREPGDVADGFRVVAIHMEDGRLDQLGDIGAVAGRAGVARFGGEANLVVDESGRAAGGSPAPRHVERPRRCLPAKAASP